MHSQIAAKNVVSIYTLLDTRASVMVKWIGLDCAVFYVPTNTVYVVRETVFTGQKTQPTVSKY